MDTIKSEYAQTTKLPRLTDYYNYRSYLRDFYLAKKSQRSDYSYRVFTRQGQLGSPSHLKMVIDGQRNLTYRTIPSYQRALGLNKKDAQYFETLVHYNQCQDPERQQEFFERLLAGKKCRGLTPLELHQYQFLSKWHHVVIYVMVGTADANGCSEEWLHSRLLNRASMADVKRSLKLLEKLELVAVNDQDQWVQTGGALSTPDEIKNVAVYRYHREMISLGLKALDEHPPEEREFNGVTVPVSPETLPIFKDKIRQFRREMNQLASSLDGGDSVYQLNIQLFPVARGPK